MWRRTGFFCMDKLAKGHIVKHLRAFLTSSEFFEHFGGFLTWFFAMEASPRNTTKD
uniref:Uncharacterized protein n=1 Tax=Phlebotomus papatasi TaxID=29031 RepID=A0A1B0CZ54_PHLPP